VRFPAAGEDNLKACARPLNVGHVGPHRFDVRIIVLAAPAEVSLQAGRSTEIISEFTLRRAI
jgi:hypothetical protein